MVGPRVIAHRGRISPWPENSLIGIKKAIEIGVDGVECDLRMTADHKIVLLHDSTVDRTTDGKGPVGDLSLDELRRLHLCTTGDGGKIGSDQTVPTLEELLELAAAGAIELRLEIKETGFEQQLVQQIRAFELAQRIVVISFFPIALYTVKTLESAIRTSLLVWSFDPVNYRHIRPYIDGMDMNVAAVVADGKILRRLKSDGLLIDFWTVNTATQLHEVTEFEPDYITSDQPRRIMKLLGREVPELKS